MVTFIEPLYKAKDSILFIWSPEPGNVAVSYKIYVGQIPVFANMAALISGINYAPGNSPAAPGKIAYKVSIGAVLTALTLTSGDFSDTVFYFALTYFDTSLVEKGPAKIVKVPPVGIVSSYMKDDPTVNRHPFVFSDDIQCWVKTAGSSSGALIVDSAADFYKSNVTIEYAYDTSNLSTIKSYLSDATSPGMPAKLTTYSYNGSGQVSKIQITDSTV